MFSLPPVPAGAEYPRAVRMSGGPTCDAVQDTGRYDIATCKRILDTDVYARIGCDEGGDVAGLFCTDPECLHCRDLRAEHDQCFFDYFFGGPAHVVIKCLGMAEAAMLCQSRAVIKKPVFFFAKDSP